MMHRITFVIICLLFSAIGIGQTTIEGKVTDQGSGEPILFGSVALFKNDVLITGTETDLDGNYIFSGLDPGTYDIEMSYVGYQATRIAGVVAKAGQINKVDITISEGVTLQTATIVAYQEPLIDFDNTTSGGTVTADQIRSLPTKNITAIAATTAGISTVDGGDISIRGSRTGGTFYYIDGVRVSGNINNFVPQSEIDQLQVIVGGIDSKYGDVTGGIISITTKGPSERFTGGLELETSQFLDPYGYNLASANVSGPLLKNKEGKSIIGFRLFGQYTSIADDDPSAVGVYRASESLIQQLENDPVSSLSGTNIPTAENLIASDVGDVIKARPNETDIDYNISAKIDARVSDAIDVTLSGSYFDSNNQFTPNTSSSTNGASNSRWAMFNWTNNPFYHTSGYRGNFRFRHKIGKQGFSDGQGEEASNSLFKNFSYTIQAGYEKTLEGTQDNNHEDNFFRYGYYGNQERDWTPVASLVSDSLQWDGPVETFNFGGPDLYFANQGYQEQVGEKTPDLSINPAQARINSEMDFLVNGFQNSVLNNVWDLYYNVGRPYNRFYKYEEDRYTANVSAGFDLLPGGSESGKHSINFGFTYEQRFLREWTITPENLWELARSNANQHIIGVDNNIVIDSFFDPNLNAMFPQFQTNIQPEEFADNLFFEKVRELASTPNSLNEYVNVDGIHPDELSLDMFSASELNNFNLISYYGYDYLGNKLPNTVKFDDFFSERDESGRRIFNVAPLQPIYVAGYLSDKFKYKDIIIRAGVRIDYYDANTNVLKDPYSLYEVEEASNFFANVDAAQPASVNDDYKVYVGGVDSEDVIGYRDGDQWFLPNGTSVSGGNLLFGGGLVYPYYKERDDQKRNITESGFDPDISFEDYSPQLNVMPRVAFSFPISNDAGFFAHYDVLVQRPPSNTGGTALDYFYMENPARFGTENSPANNPNLKPEKTVDYEVGFQSKLSNSSAIKISAYYKEMRDMIQRRYYANLPAPLNSYQTFSNVDFGTVKGFSFGYDLRRTGNLQMSFAYTLQFADGSGSDANSSGGINERGVIRELFPLSFDERHRISASMDYRFASGKQYNGPKIGGLDIFANAGLNLLLTGVSGRPYSQYEVVDVPLGQTGLVTINEARLPWILNADARVDKQFSLSLGTEETSRSLNFNVFFRVENLFNTRNVVDVFNVSNDPETDGYWQSSNGLDQRAQIVATGRNVDSFEATYNWRILQPGHYTRPRRMYLGLVFDF